MKQYQKKNDPSLHVTAVQLKLDLVGGVMKYNKWGGEQTGKQEDWLIDNNGEVYTCDAETFASTYEEVGPGRYMKTQKIWAEQAVQDGHIPTKEGSTLYRAGEWIVANDENGKDVYAISDENFTRMYEEVSS